MINCLLCGQPATLLFRARDYRRPDDPKEWPLYWCDQCRFGRLAGDITPQEVATFYPPDYYTHGAPTKADAALSFLDRLRVHLAWRFDAGVALDPGEVARPHGRSPKFCDLGCGSGAQLGKFKSAGYDVIGVEPDPRARVVAEKMGEAVDGTAENIPAKVAGMRFDVVLMSHVLEHCIDPVKALSNVGKILTPQGTLVIEVPNIGAAGFSRFRALWPWTDIPRHLNFFTERALRRALAMSGFDVKRAIYVGYARQFRPEWIRMQERVWERIGAGRKPNFRLASWGLLLRTAFAPNATKYDSVRVHAVRADSK